MSGLITPATSTFGTVLATAGLAPVHWLVIALVLAGVGFAAWWFFFGKGKKD